MPSLYVKAPGPRDSYALAVADTVTPPTTTAPVAVNEPLS